MHENDGTSAKVVTSLMRRGKKVSTDTTQKKRWNLIFVHIVDSKILVHARLSMHENERTSAKVVTSLIRRGKKVATDTTQKKRW